MSFSPEATVWDDSPSESPMSSHVRNPEPEAGLGREPIPHWFKAYMRIPDMFSGLFLYSVVLGSLDRPAALNQKAPILAHNSNVSAATRRNSGCSHPSRRDPQMQGQFHISTTIFVRASGVFISELSKLRHASLSVCPIHRAGKAGAHRRPQNCHLLRNFFDFYYSISRRNL